MGDITRRQRKRAIARHVAAVQARTRGLYGTARMEGEGTEADRAAAAAAAAEKAKADAAADAAKAGGAGGAAGGAGGAGGGAAGGAAGGSDPTEEELAALGDAGKRALERIRAERDAKAAEAAKLAEKAAAYDKLEEANKTEQQRKDEAAAAAIKTAEESTLKLWKIEAALAAGLPHTAAARLVGTTEAELKKDAEAYKAELAANGTTKRRVTTDANAGGDAPAGGMSALIRQRAGRAG